MEYCIIFLLGLLLFLLLRFLGFSDSIAYMPFLIRLGLSLVLALRAVLVESTIRAPTGVPPPNPPAWVGDVRKS
jgi:hypothetical protein